MAKGKDGKKENAIEVNYSDLALLALHEDIDGVIEYSQELLEKYVGNTSIISTDMRKDSKCAKIHTKDCRELYIQMPNNRSERLGLASVVYAMSKLNNESNHVNIHSQSGGGFSSTHVKAHASEQGRRIKDKLDYKIKSKKASTKPIVVEKPKHDHEELLEVGGLGDVIGEGAMKELEQECEIYQQSVEEEICQEPVEEAVVETDTSPELTRWALLTKNPKEKNKWIGFIYNNLLKHSDKKPSATVKAIRSSLEKNNIEVSHSTVYNLAREYQITEQDSYHIPTIESDQPVELTEDGTGIIETTTRTVTIERIEEEGEWMTDSDGNEFIPGYTEEINEYTENVFKDDKFTETTVKEIIITDN